MCIKGAPATRTAAAVPGAYRYPLRQGHSVTMIIHEIDGGFGPDAVKLLNTMANKHGNNRLGAEALVAPWCARSFKTRYAMRISIAIHSGVAAEIRETVETDTAMMHGCANA